MSEPAQSKARRLRLIYMGMGGVLSSQPLKLLLQAGFRFEAVIMAAPGDHVAWRQVAPPAATARGVPLVSPSPSIMQLSWEHHIPLYESGDLQASPVFEALQALAPDVALVSCFAHRVPQRLLDASPHGFLNLHPSRLPHYRGPYPLFWQLRDGLRDIGVTVHRMSKALDSGPIVQQSTVRLADGLNGQQIEHVLGDEGGRLFIETLQSLATGTLMLRPQQETGSYQGLPQESDFGIDQRWTARRAFNFMRGTAQWRRPYIMSASGRRWLLQHALSYDPHGKQPSAVQEVGGRLRIQFDDGILEASPWP